MRRVVAAVLAAGIFLGPLSTAACAGAQAADPFPSVAGETPAHVSHRWAYASMLGGAGLVGLSFVLTDRANRVYADYLQATDPAEVTRLYDEAQRYDRWSATSLLTGEALFAAGVWLRFLHRPAPRRVSLEVEPTRCVVSLRF